MNDFFRNVFEEVDDFFSPLVYEIGTLEDLNEFLIEVGYPTLVDLTESDSDTLLLQIQHLEVHVDAINQLTKDPPKTFSEFKEALKTSSTAFDSFKELTSSLSQFSSTQIDYSQFGTDTLNLLTIIYLIKKAPWIYYFLDLISLIKKEAYGVKDSGEIIPLLNNTGEDLVFIYQKRRILLDEIIPTISNLFQTLKQNYWSESIDDLSKAKEIARGLFIPLRAFMSSLGFHAYYGQFPSDESLPEDIIDRFDTILTIQKGYIFDDDWLETGISISVLSAEDGGPGFSFYPFGKFAFNDFLGNWQVNTQLKGSTPAFDITDSGITFETQEASFSMEALFRKIKEENKAIIIGETEGSRLEIGDVFFEGGLNLEKDNYDAYLYLGLNNIDLILNGSDGFLKEIIPKDGISVNFDMSLGYSLNAGLHFRTTGNLEGEVSSIFSIGNFQFRNLKYQILLSDTLHFNISTNFLTKIGPLEASVNNFGLSFAISFSEQGDLNLGPIDFDVDFAPPKGIGLAVKSPVISGGGFLEFDPDNHRYAGVLTLNFLELELTAIGLINTRLPNNQKGFSMLISISVLFAPPIQLSFGFTLNGVGGLIGIRRTVKVDVLQERIRKGEITSIMFPKDIIKNAPKIISDLRSIFPPKKGHYVVAPFLRIGWGSPTIVEIDLGVVVEIPFKSRVLLLGSVGLYLPNKTIKKRLVELHIDIFGDFNFAESYVLIEGRLRDSHVVGIPLTGGFAFVLDWGRQPQFLMSVGGYHPRYKKPARFPDIPRLTASIKKGEDITLTCEYYQAITSNSFQIGFSANLVVRKGKAKAVGFLGFNALLQFDPFRFEIDIHINVSVSYRGKRFLGVELYFELSGPKPWRAKGYAKIDLWLFSLKVRFNYEWGGKQIVQRRTIETLDLLERLQKQLSEKNNWSAKLASGFSNAAALRKLEETEQNNQILVHPSGFLELRQNLLPLNRTIDKLGSEYVNKAGYSIVDYQIGEESVVKIDQADIKEYFSRGQFEELPDDKKLSTPDFELMSAGVAVESSDAYDFSTEFQFTDNGFDNIILMLEEEDGEKVVGRSTSDSAYNWQQNRQMNLLMDQHQRNLSQSASTFGLLDDLPEYGGKKYQITHKDNLDYPPNLEYPYFDTYSAAAEYLQQNLKAKKWQIMEVVEEMV